MTSSGSRAWARGGSNRVHGLVGGGSSNRVHGLVGGGE